MYVSTTFRNELSDMIDDVVVCVVVIDQPIVVEAA